MPFLNKKQSDSLGWTDKTDANDVIVLDDEGNIVKRRPVSMITIFMDENGEPPVTEHSWSELSPEGKWIWKSKRD